MEHRTVRAVALAGVAVALGACAPSGGREVGVDDSLRTERGARHPRDFVLTETWEPRSGEVIDCRGGSILPATLASDNNGLSVPDTLIFLGPDVHGVRVQNCTLDATLPIVAMEGGAHRISGNTIAATGAAITLIGSDHNQIDRNVVSSSFRNVLIVGDSDGNVVWRNDLSSAPDRPTWEGRPGLLAPVEPEGIGLGTFAYPGVSNAVVNGVLHQHLSYWDTHPDGTFVADNAIHIEAGGIGIIFATRSSHATAARNTITGGDLGLAVFGYSDDAWFVEAGTCSDAPSMHCQGDVEEEAASFITCNLPGLPPGGTCEGVQWVEGGGRVVAPTFVGNEVSGAFIGLTAGSSEGATIERNDFTDGVFGIELWGYALGDSTVRGNVTSGNEVGLLINDDWPGTDPAGLDLSYNDFGDNDAPLYARLVQWNPSPDDPDEWFPTGFPYTLNASLPDNWWGSDPCGLPANPEQWPDTYDPSPAAEPIAMAWRRRHEHTVPRCTP